MEGFQQNKGNIVYENRGTPQGGPLSPLLSNIALHGLENHLKTWVETQPFKHYRNQRRRDKRKSLGVIRYADDFVVLHRDRSVINAAKTEVELWLAKTSKLSLSDAKTRTGHTKQGFYFLGWQFIHLKRNGKYYTHIQPRKKAQKQILLRVKNLIQSHRASSAYALIEKLKPVLIGWCNYHKHVQSAEIFSSIDHQVFCKLRPWVFRHRKAGRKKLKEKYMPSGRQDTDDGKVHFDN